MNSNCKPTKLTSTVLSFFFFLFTCFLFGYAGSQLQHVGSSSLTRGQTRAPALGAWSLSLWTTREVPTVLS